MESVRIQLSGNRIKANGRIVAAADESHPAFSAYYDLQTDDSGATRRFGLTVTLAERERQLAIARDEENMWLVTDGRGESRAGYGGALDIDVSFSPFFNALPIRRGGLHEHAAAITAPTIYVRLPALSVVESSSSHSNSAESRSSVNVHSAACDTVATIDGDGFIVDYPGLAERI